MSKRELITDLVQIKRLGEQKREENQRLRRHMKSHNFVERRLKLVAAQIEDEIDCQTCANCCRVATVKLKPRDVDKLQRFLSMRLNDFRRDCTEESPEEGLVLKRTEKGCVFLEGNECTVYDARPHTCQNFPHFVRGEGSLVSRMWEMPDRAAYCPIAYNTLEAFKDEVEFKK